MGRNVRSTKFGLTFSPIPELFISPTEPAVLRALGTTSLLPETYGMDIFYMPTKLGIQRKTIPDLYASISDGRLSKQIAQRQSSDIEAVLLVEGNPGNPITPMTEEQIWMAILSIQRSGYLYIQTRNLTHTLATVGSIVKYYDKPSHALVNRPPSIHSDWRLTLLQLLPGVGGVKAVKILSEMGFPFEIKDQDKFAKIVGKITYQKITDYLNK